MNRNSYTIIFTTAIFLVFTYTSFAYDNKTTHRLITEQAVKSEKDYLRLALQNNFGLSAGSDTVVNGKTVLNWLSDGSEYEDEPMCRASNHFHNPLRTWGQSFMSDDTKGKALDIRYYCNSTGWKYSDRKSAITWATGYLTAPPNGQKASFSSALGYEPFNWDKARNNFYNALVSSVNNKGYYEYSQQYYWIETFKALGHVMHLLQDMAVPAHVRNDFQSHLIDNEYKTLLNPFSWYKQPYEYYVQNNPILVTSAKPTLPTFDNVKLTDFWDTDTYNGSNQNEYERGVI